MVISSVELGNDGNEFIPQGILFPVGQAVHSILPVLKEKQKITLLSAWKSYREYRVTKKTHTESHDMFQKYIAYIRDPSEREETLRLLKGIAEAI